MNVLEIADFLRRLQERTSTPEGRADILAILSQQEKCGRLDAEQVKLICALIDWLERANLEGKDCFAVIDDLTRAIEEATP